MEKSKLESMVALDLRSLGLFRIALGLLVTVDALYRGRELHAFFSTDGVVPPDAFARHSTVGTWSPLLWFDGVWWPGLFIAALAGSGLLIAIGRATRPAIGVAWLALLALNLRNPYIRQVADTLLPLLLMWGLFLPLSKRLVVGQKAPLRPGTSVSAAGVFFQLQILLVYVEAGIYKMYSGPWVKGSILIEGLHIDPVARDFGRRLLAFPGLLKGAGIAAVPFEVVGPLFAWIPWRTDAFRAVTVGVFIAFHLLGIGLLLDLALIPYLMAMVWLPLIPGGVWDRLLPRPDAAPEHHRSGTRTNRLVMVLAALSFSTAVPDFFMVPTPQALKPTFAFLERIEVGQGYYSLWTKPLGSRHYVIAATLADGTEVDLHAGRPLDWQSPRRTPYDNHWYKLFQDLRQEPWLRHGVTTWFVQEWERTHPHSPPVQQVVLGIFQVPRQPPAWWLSRASLPVDQERWLYRWQYTVRHVDGEARLGPQTVIRKEKWGALTPVD